MDKAALTALLEEYLAAAHGADKLQGGAPPSDEDLTRRRMNAWHAINMFLGLQNEFNGDNARVIVFDGYRYYFDRDGASLSLTLVANERGAEGAVDWLIRMLNRTSIKIRIGVEILELITPLEGALVNGVSFRRYETLNDTKFIQLFKSRHEHNILEIIKLRPDSYAYVVKEIPILNAGDVSNIRKI